MDIQLQELIDKIKKDGVASAEAKAQEIIAEAEKKAASIISSAEEKADSIIKSGKAETERMEKASIDAIRQAGRNLLISFRDGVNAQLSALIATETSKVYNADMLKTLIPETVKVWASKDDVNSLSVLLSEKDLKELEKDLGAALKEQINSGLEIKLDNSLTKGFRIGTKDGSAFYDFSAESVADLFSAYLNPKTSAIMKEAAKEGL
jgi:V/A-type H+-transporting ATPase subunit E